MQNICYDSQPTGPIEIYKIKGIGEHSKTHEAVKKLVKSEEAKGRPGNPITF